MPYNNDSKPISGDVFLLTENNEFLTQEDTGKILLDGSQSYSNDSKAGGSYSNDSKGSSLYTNDSK